MNETTTLAARADLVAEAARACMVACAELAAAGLTVLSAHARPGAPLVLVTIPPERSGLHGALRRRTRYEEVLIDRLPSGVLVQWCRRRAGVRP